MLSLWSEISTISHGYVMTLDFPLVCYLRCLSTFTYVTVSIQELILGVGVRRAL